MSIDILVRLAYVAGGIALGVEASLIVALVRALARQKLAEVVA